MLLSLGKYYKYLVKVFNTYNVGIRFKFQFDRWLKNNDELVFENSRLVVVVVVTYLILFAAREHVDDCHDISMHTGLWLPFKNKLEK